MDREKLSKVVLEHLREREQENRGWQAAAKLRLERWWGGFGTLSVWEKTIIAGVALLVVMGVPAAIYAFSSGGGDSTPVVSAPRPTIQRNTTPFPTPTPYPRSNATPKPIGVGGSGDAATPTLSPEETNRQDCEAIRGTDYRSEEERLWYLDNCPADNGGGGNGSHPTAPPPPPPPTATPPPSPDQGLTAGQAIAMGAQFLAANETDYTVTAGGCTASDSGSFWAVSCHATLIGCGGGACQSKLRVCVFETPLLVDYC